MISPPYSAASSRMNLNFNEQQNPVGQESFSSSSTFQTNSNRISVVQFGASSQPSPPSSYTSPNFTPPPAATVDQASFKGTWITPGPEGDNGNNNEEFVFENGRRYLPNPDGTSYWLPNDEREQERDDLKHNLFLLMMRGGSLHYAPVEEKLRAGGMLYDLGTGTGTWALDVAERYGNAQVYACDISPIQPTYVWSNVFFSLDDFEEEWIDFPENTFDFIHMRHTAYAVRDTDALLQRIMKHLKPGGYVEFQEMHWWPKCDDGTLTDETPYALRDFCHYEEQGLHNLGVEMHLVTRIPQKLRDTGFDDVTEIRHKCPIGTWARDQKQRERGALMNVVITDGLSALATRPLGQGLGWQPVQIEMFLLSVRNSLRVENGIHAYFPFNVIYGRKPQT